MTNLSEQLPHTMAFPHALGTGLIVQSTLPADAPATGTAQHGISLYDSIDILIDGYEAALSRFRSNSTVSRMSKAEHGGTFDFPDWAEPLFDLYDRLFAATEGAIDPCVGEDLIRLGYDAAYSFTVASDAFGIDDSSAGAECASIDGETPVSRAGQGKLGAIHGRPTWVDDVERHGTTLITRRPVSLDFGACGKGYLVDLIAAMLGAAGNQPVYYVIDAGGDLLIHTAQPITIALEDPSNPANAVGVAELSCGTFCASAPSRRHWGEAAGHQLHHLLNAIDGLPVDDVAATWVSIAPNAQTTYPTAVADGLATALFTTPAAQLRKYFNFDCAVLNADRTAAQSADFPGGFFQK